MTDGGERVFLAETFHERPPRAMRDVPVHVAQVVAGDVFAQFPEEQASPLEMAQRRVGHQASKVVCSRAKFMSETTDKVWRPPQFPPDPPEWFEVFR
jgi:hypothetical protein